MTWAITCLVSILVITVLAFVVIYKLFLKSSQIPNLPVATTTTVLPASGITKDDVDALQFAQVAHGYKISEVDWVLERLGMELDQLRAELFAAQNSSHH